MNSSGHLIVTGWITFSAVVKSMIYQGSKCISFYIAVPYKVNAAAHVCHLAAIHQEEIYLLAEELRSVNNLLHFLLLCLPVMKPCQGNVENVLETQ